MSLSKLNLTVIEAEGAFEKLQQALSRNDKPAIDNALGELQKKLKSIKELSESRSASDVVPASTVKKYVGWRVLHKAEGGYDKNPLNMPEVIPPINPRAVKMTKEIQEMSFALMQHFNPAVTKKIWTVVHDHDRAFTNFNGFGKRGDLRANFLTGSDLSKELPKYDKAQRLCGGQFVRGIVRGDKLVCIPGEHGINAAKPLPSLEMIVENNWYLFAITLFSRPEKVGHFPQGKGGPVAIPFIFDREIEFDLNLFDKWEADELPDPLKMYR